jgi:ABC-type antimicrobial peptide transport system permease subunit
VKWKDYGKLGWDQLKRRKVVTALCAAGIAIGSASIIVALSFGESVTHFSQQRMSYYLKTDEITVFSGASGGVEGDFLASSGGLTKQKMEIIRELPHVEAVASYRELGEFQFTVDETKQGYFTLIATETDMLEKFGNEFQQGTPSGVDNTVVIEYGVTTDLQDERTRRVESMMMQGLEGRERYEQMQKLRRLSYPLYRKQIALESRDRFGGSGESHKLNVPLRVAGVLKKPEGMPDDMVMNLRTAYVTPELGQKIVDALQEASGKTSSSAGEGARGAQQERNRIDRLVVKVDSSLNVKQVEEWIQRLNLSTSSNLHREEQMQGEFVIVRIVFGGIGSFVLFVASISIVVAMTMSTYQRRRQIGIMKVLGASLAQIRNMFIVESALLGLLGGIIGIILSYWVIWAINIVVYKFAGNSPDELLFISLWILPVGLFFAVMTGVLSGIYPAVKASRTDALTAIKRD